MPRRFADLSYAPTQQLYVGQPVEEIKALAQTADQKYQENQAASDSLDIAAKNLNVLDPDYVHKKQAIDNLKLAVADTARRGDWEQAGNVVRGAAKDFMTNDAVKKAQQSYQAQQAHFAALDKLGYSKDYISTAKAKSIAEYKGIHKDDVTGEYTGVYGGYTPAKEIDRYAKAEEWAKGWVPDEHSKSVKRVFLNQDKDWIYETVDGHTIKFTDQEQMKRDIARRMAADPEVQSYTNTLNDYDNFRRRDQPVNISADEASGVPDNIPNDPETVNAYHTYKRSLLSQNPNMTEKQISDAFENAMARHQENMGAIGFGVDKYGFIQEGIVDERGIKTANPYSLQRKAEELKNGPTLFNQSVLVPGESFDGNALATNLQSTTQQLKQVEADINSGNGDYNQLIAKKRSLQRLQNIQKNTFSNVMDNYWKADGGTNLNEAYNNAMTYHGFKGSIDEFKQAIADSADPTPGQKLLYMLTAGEAGTTAFAKYASRLREAASEHAKEAGVSYSANVLSGGTAAPYQKMLTAEVTKDKTNYIVEGGVQLDQYLKENLPEGATMQISPYDGPIGDQYGFNMTINDKSGRTIKQIPIYPASEQGATLVDQIGRRLMEDNRGNRDEHEQSLFNTGLRMRADRNNPDIDTRSIEAETGRVTDRSPVGDSADSRPMSVNIGEGGKGGKYQAIIRKTRVAEDAGNGRTGINTVWQLIPVIDGVPKVTPALTTKSLQDLKAQLFNAQ